MSFRLKTLTPADGGPPPDPLDDVLLGFSPEDPFTIRDACQGVQIFGETGSGKTSGSGRHFALSYLAAGFGGLVLTANPDDADLWRSYAAAIGRSQDLIFFGPSYPDAFNFMAYAASNGSDGPGMTRNLIDLFLTLGEIDNAGGKGGLNETFWRNELGKLLANSIDLLRFAGEPITLPAIYDIVITAPKDYDEWEDEEYQRGSLCARYCKIAEERMLRKDFNKRDHFDCALTLRYWGREFIQMDERPKTSTIASFSGIADMFLRGQFHTLFCDRITVRPEECFDGKVIVLDMPVKTYKAMGIFGQVVFKYCWQKAVERRQTGPHDRPVFLWADESQYFVNSHDAMFQSTARSSRVCTVYLTQNLPNYFNRLGGGGDNGKSMTEALLGNLTTKIFHNNNCTITNNYASELFAKTWQNKPEYSTSDRDNSTSNTYTTRTELREQVIPHDFTGLMNGGPENDFGVEAIINQRGKVFNHTGTNAVRTLFRQK